MKETEADKPLGEPLPYRPKCLLNNAGKLFERIIYKRLFAITEKEGGFSGNLLGFLKKKPKIDAVNLVANS